MKKIITALMVTLGLFSLVACNQSANQELGSSKVDEGYIAITAPDGKEIMVPEKIDSIISMAPSFTEVIMDLGYGDKLIAVDKNSQGIEGLPEDVLYLDMMTPDVEQIIALDPDLMWVSTMTTKDGAEHLLPLEKEGIPIVYIPSSDSIEGIYEDLIFMSKILGEEEKGQALVDSMKAKIAEIQEKSKAVTTVKKVYFEISAAPHLYSFGKGVFLDEMITMIGAENILRELDGWKSISEEIVLAANPDVIITNIDYIEDPVGEIKSRSGWENIGAVKNDQVYYIDNISSSRSNHNIIKALEEMARVIYPEVY